MRGRTVIETGSNDVFVPIISQTATPTRPPALPSNHPATRRGPQQEVPSVQVDFQPPVGNGNEEEIIDNFPELFDCFSTDGFDPKHFKGWA